jgi:Fe-S-cluster containining protein
MTLQNPFYEKGLRFSCLRCSTCCRHTPGFVFLSEKDLHGIAGFLHMSPEEVRRRFCRIVQVGGFKRLSLKEKGNLDCVFWEAEGCTIYRERPLQCRSFPFWSANLLSRDAWERAAEMCPGIGKGKKHSGKSVSRWLARRTEERLIAEDD